MTTETDIKRRVGLKEEDLEGLSLREVVLETLLQLHIDFGVLGRINEAAPLLYELMELAYYTKLPQQPSAQSKTKPEPKPAFN